MDEQLIALVDLLGFTSVIRDRDRARHDEILALLTRFVDVAGNSGSESKCIGDGSTERAVWPAISAFSDHIVFSYKADSLAYFGGLITHTLADNVAWIFSRAIQLGCLVRGGIALGPLHHEGGVVFGPALIEAHDLESKLAGRPRIIVSAGAAKRLGSDFYLYSDDDGFSCLDYVRAAYDMANQSKFNSDRMESARNWITGVRTLCEDQVSALASNNNLVRLQNWRWFQTRFERFVADLHPSNGG